MSSGAMQKSKTNNRNSRVYSGSIKTDDSPSLTKIAARINAHLLRFEATPEINLTRRGSGLGTSTYYGAVAYQAGRYCYVVYIRYQGGFGLTKQAAIDYLAWLDAGGVGQHFRQQAEARKKGR